MKVLVNCNARKKHESMKKHLSLLLTVGLAISSQAGTYNIAGTSSGAIPDGDLSGWQNTITASSLPSIITDVKVNLTLTGGWNGDLYAYLTHGSGFAVLLNREGKGTGASYGYGTSGMNVTLGYSTAGADIHGVATPTSGGTYSADARGLWPFGSNSDFDTATRTANLDGYNGTDPNGGWTLFFADVQGGYQSTLTGWSLDITAVPEPVTVALGIFGVLFGAVQGVRYFRRKTSAQ